MNTDQRMLNSDGFDLFSILKSQFLVPCSVFKIQKETQK
jgi:hypothetical protein